MTYSNKLAVIFLTSTLAACGGGGSGEVTLKTASGDLSTQPIAQDRSTLNETIARGEPFFQVVQPSLQDAFSTIMVDENFNPTLVIGGESFDNWQDISGVSPHPENRLYSRDLRSTDRSRAIYVNLPNGAPLDEFSKLNDESLDYSTFGLWITGENLEDFVDINIGTTTDMAAFFGGIVTTIDGMPQTGEATYRGGSLVGVRNDTTGMTSIFKGSATFTADFQANSMSGRLTFDPSRNEGAEFGDITSNGMTISANTFSGNASSANGQSGSIEGVFTGPNAAELAGSIDLQGNGSSIRGAFGAAR